jgi:hypothetical protein
VIVTAGEICGTADIIPTTTGRVVSTNDTTTVGVELDTNPIRDWWFSLDRVQVVDREPVEWPNGWSLRAVSGLSPIPVVDHPHGGTLSLDRELIDKIVVDGPYVLENWDELVGE